MVAAVFDFPKNQILLRHAVLRNVSGERRGGRPRPWMFVLLGGKGTRKRNAKTNLSFVGLKL